MPVKKTITLLLACLLLASACPAVRAEGVAVEIRDRAGLEAIAQDPAGHYVLTADIDLGDGDWTPIPFSGTLDGAGHTVLNLHVTEMRGSRTTYDGNDKPYTSTFAGLFSELVGAEITDLNLLGALIEIENSDNAFAGMLAGYVENSSISNCTVSGRVHMATYAIDAGIGGIAGYGCGSFLNCSSEAELVHEDHTSEHRCEEFVGGILGCGIAHIEGCTSAIEAYVSCNGFAHNGGLTGMYHVCGFSFEDRVVSDNFVSGTIRFYENNYIRKAYCEPYYGEHLSATYRATGNNHAFHRAETWDYSQILRPETCANPDYETTVTEAACDSFGFETHSCRGCGYSYTDSYTLKQHESGAWETVTPATTEREGLEQRHCLLCGALTDERVLERLVLCQSLTLSQQHLALHPGDSLVLDYELLPAEASDRSLLWTSGDETVATVSADGLITAIDSGEALIIAHSADGAVSAACTVKVSKTFGQWLGGIFR